MFLENYYLKNKRSVEKGVGGPTHAWVIPAGQRRRGEAASLVNFLRRQGVEIHAAAAEFQAGATRVAAGDYIVRLDQPFGNLVDDVPRHAVLRGRQPAARTTTPAGRSRFSET